MLGNRLSENAVEGNQNCFTQENTFQTLPNVNQLGSHVTGKESLPGFSKHANLSMQKNDHYCNAICHNVTDCTEQDHNVKKFIHLWRLRDFLWAEEL